LNKKYFFLPQIVVPIMFS